ncbi:type I-E CRISPR-associated protein Cas6/Cse3/CasE, partial [bacterium]|nr:type I-E CRISPR-associated protein Cas6/Cse3/CasE [bacterium]
MIYLSRLRLNPESRRIKSELGMPYELHRTLSRAFNHENGTKPRVMFRVDDYGGRGRPAVVIVQSDQLPDWERVTWKPHDIVEIAPPRELEPDLVEGTILSFRLRANPTIKTRSRARPEKKTRVPIYNDDKLLEWLQRKGSAGGFVVKQSGVIIVKEGTRKTGERHNGSG